MEEKEKRFTKKDNLLKIIEILEGSSIERKDELITFCNEQIASIDKKAEASRNRAAAKRAEGDELRAVIKSVLTNELQTADDITAQIEGDDVTVAKIRARLTQLVNLGEAAKEDIKTEDGKTKKAYKLA